MNGCRPTHHGADLTSQDVEFGAILALGRQEIIQRSMTMNKKFAGALPISQKSERFSYILVHHYCDEKFLFQTITMYPEAEREQVMDKIVNNKSWYWGRFAHQNRSAYLQKRLLAEAQMYQEFSRKYWTLKESCPVYFYLYPHFSPDDIQAKLNQRKMLDEPHTRYLLIDLDDLEDNINISFTILDSLISYREKLVSQGALYGREGLLSAYEELGSIFHISEITHFMEKYAHIEDLCFEVQIWDAELLLEWQKTYSNLS
jgi:hypothetical protein